MRNEQASNTDESDGGYLESVGGQKVLYNPHHLRRGENSALDEDEHVTQTIGPDADHGDEQDLGLEGWSDEPHLNKHDQNTCANTNIDDSRDIIELGGGQCSDTRGVLIPGEEEKRILSRPNMETSVMDTETDNTRVEDQTILPGDLGEPGGERCFDTGADPTQGKEEKRTLVRPDTETSDMVPETDNTHVLNNNELNLQLDSVEDEEVTERDLANIKVTKENGADDVTTLSPGRNHNDTSVETTGGPAESDQLRHDIGPDEYTDRTDRDSGDDAVMVDHLAEGPEGRWYDRTTVTVNAQQQTKDPSEMFAHVIQAVREQEPDEREEYWKGTRK
jgi:hypothetical protein